MPTVHGIRLGDLGPSAVETMSRTYSLGIEHKVIIGNYEYHKWGMLNCRHIIITRNRGQPDALWAVDGGLDEGLSAGDTP